MLNQDEEDTDLEEPVVKTGDLVHIPANVVLSRDALFGEELVGLKHFVTKVPKKALVLRKTNDPYIVVEYGEHSWNVDRKYITLLEFKNDS